MDDDGCYSTQQILEERVAARTRELAALYDVTAVASASLDLETVLARSLARVLEVMSCTGGGIHLLKDGGTLHLAAWQGSPAQPVTGSGQGSPVGDLVARVLDSGTPVVVADGAETASGTMRAWAGAPLHGKGRTLGALSVVGRPGHIFQAEEVALLASIADQVGVAVENARLYGQAEQLAVLEERARLARELHDSVTQSLYTIGLMAETGRMLAGSGDLEGAASSLARLETIAQEALGEMRMLVFALHPPALEADGLVGALEKRLEAVERRAGMEARLVVEGEIDLPAAAAAALYRIAQEALNNILHHAHASAVTVHLLSDGRRLAIDISDDGRGFDPGSAGRHGGVGLRSMEERAQAMGATLAIASAPGEGTTVRVAVERGPMTDGAGRRTEAGDG